MGFFDGLKLKPGFKESLLASGENLKQDMRQNPTKFAMMGTAISNQPLRGKELGKSILNSRRAIEKMTIPQVLERAQTNMPKPSSMLNAQIDEVRAAIDLNKRLGNAQEVSNLARQWAQLVRQRASL